MTGGNKILLGQLGKRGDCLYATSVARQIKHDYPGCELTWAISPICRSIIDGNPFVDFVWEVPQENDDNLSEVWNLFEQEAKRRKENGEYDEIFLTQVHPGNFQNYDGTSRSSLFRGYPHPITESVQPVLRLSNAEVERVREFVTKNNLTEGDAVILFECASTSGQSVVTPDFALKTASLVLNKHKNVKFVVSSNVKIESDSANTIDASVVSFRENAELTKYCSLLIGCSSGISWIATSDWAKPIPQLQVLSQKTRMYASMIHDARYFGLPTDHIMEFQDLSARRLANIVLFILEHGFAEARQTFQKEISVKFDYYLSQVYWVLLSKRRFVEAAQAIRFARERYSYDPKGIIELDNILAQTLSPYLDFHWRELNDIEKDAFQRMMYVPTKNGYLTTSFKSIVRLTFQSVFGKNKMAAQSLLLDIVRHVFKRVL